MSGVGKLDLNLLAQPQLQAWYSAEAKQFSDLLTKRVMRIPGATPMTALAIILLVFEEAAAVACVHAPEGFTATAHQFGVLLEQRLNAKRFAAEMAVRGAYLYNPTEEPKK